MTQNPIILISYIASAVLFIIGIKQLGKVNTARRGNLLSSIGMLIAIIATFSILSENKNISNYSIYIILAGILLGSIIGMFAAMKVAMTSMPEMVAIFNGFGGGASTLIASAEFIKIINGNAINNDVITLITIMFSIIIGSITFTGSFIAWGKLQGKISGQPITFPGQNIINGLILIILFIVGYSTITNMNNYLHNGLEINLIWFYIIIGIY